MTHDDEPICRTCNEPLEDASDGFGTLVHLPETEPHDHEPEPIEEPGNHPHPECLRFGYIQDGRCCGHAPEED